MSINMGVRKFGPFKCRSVLCHILGVPLTRDIMNSQFLLFKTEAVAFHEVFEEGHPRLRSHTI